MEKLLTVAVPAYNATWCLDKCLSSFITDPILEELEVIIINDGSTDNTREVAMIYIEKYPSVFKLLDKENGGHGSAINEAIKQAKGKYFKVVDADDWIVTENLNSLLDVLSETEADAVLNHFQKVDMTSGRREVFQIRDISLNKVYSLDEFTAHPGKIYHCVSFHGLTYRTKIYRESDTVLTEGIYYEDQEYATLPFLKVKTILPLDMYFYEYLVGNINQSISDSNQVARLWQIEHVVSRLFRLYHENPEVSAGARRYFAHRAMEVLFSYYMVVLVKNPDKPNGRREASEFRQKMWELEPKLVEKTDRRYKIAIVMNRLGFTGRTLKLFKHPAPYALYQKVFKRNREVR